MVPKVFPICFTQWLIRLVPLKVWLHAVADLQLIQKSPKKRLKRAWMMFYAVSLARCGVVMQHDWAVDSDSSSLSSWESPEDLKQELHWLYLYACFGGGPELWLAHADTHGVTKLMFWCKCLTSFCSSFSRIESSL